MTGIKGAIELNYYLLKIIQEFRLAIRAVGEIIISAR